MGVPKAVRAYLGTALLVVATKVLHPETKIDLLEVALRAARERAKERFGK